MAQESGWLHKIGKKLGFIKEDDRVESSTSEIDGNADTANENTQSESFHGGSDAGESSSEENTPPASI